MSRVRVPSPASLSARNGRRGEATIRLRDRRLCSLWCYPQRGRALATGGGAKQQSGFANAAFARSGATHNGAERSQRAAGRSNNPASRTPPLLPLARSTPCNALCRESPRVHRSDRIACPRVKPRKHRAHETTRSPQTRDGMGARGRTPRRSANRGLSKFPRLKFPSVNLPERSEVPQTRSTLR